MSTLFFVLRFCLGFRVPFKSTDSSLFLNFLIYLTDMQPYTIILFYRFTPIVQPEQFRDEQKIICHELGLKGRLLIAKEGINGTFEGTAEKIEQYKQALTSQPGFAGLVFKESVGTGHAFTKLEIKVRPEVITLGSGSFDFKTETAAELSAAELEALYNNNEDFAILDLRNDFEVEVGCFEKTINPKLENFRDLPGKLSELEHLKEKKLVAVCTGGIRCEKATCLLKQKGFKNIYQLKDGIHTYIQEFPKSRFKGSLFVFDNRMTTTVVDDLEHEIISRCVYCRELSEQFYSDDSVRPSKKVICCDACFLNHQDRLRSCNPAKLSLVAK